jgi:hypothetical protein
MLKFIFGNCNCSGSNAVDISADVELFNLDIIDVLQVQEIELFLDIKFSLNCTTVSKGDVLYLSRYHSNLKKGTKLNGSELNEKFL